MKNLKDKTVLWVDNGLFCDFARRIAPHFGENYYWSPWANGFPSQKQTKLGDGFTGITRVNYPQLIEDKIDLFVFLDLFHSDWAQRLRRDGKRVWAAGRGEDVELDREGFREWAKRNGFPLAPGEFVTGTDALRKALPKDESRWVKMADGHNRGDGETWKWKGEHLGTPRLDEKIYDLGAFKETTRFLVEKELKEVIELGEDLFAVRNMWPKHVMQGLEIKGLGTVSIIKPYEDLPDCLKLFNEKLGRVFAGEQSSTFFCMEGLYNQKKEFFPMDPCVRLGSPSNELMAALFDAASWAQTLWDGAEGVMTSPKPVAKYGIVTMAYNEQSGKNWMPLKYPKEADQWIFLRNPYSLHGKRYAVPQGPPTNIAGVVGIGDTLLEAARAVGKHSKMLDGNMLEIATDSLTQMLDAIKKSNAWGATFTRDALPSVEELKKAIG